MSEYKGESGLEPGKSSQTPMNLEFPQGIEEEDNNPFDHSLLTNAINKSNLASNIDGNENEDSVLLFDKPKDSNGGASIINATVNSIQINSESRINKLLKPNSNIQIQITEANNSSEGMLNTSKKYVVYTIKLTAVNNPKDEIQIRRRYSDFESLRDILTKIFPLIIIPPIPPKNYMSFGILNNLVGSKSNTQNIDPKKDPQSYSYINSTHLNSNKLIEHRKRLLTNFLNNCLGINQIRNLEFFSKFLDPNTNWQDEINLITTQLPKDIYHLNPENGLKTDPIYANFPNVGSGPIKMGFLNNLLSKSKQLSAKTGSLINGNNQTINNTTETSEGSDETESGSNDISPKVSNDTTNIKRQSINTSHLDNINRKIMENFIGLSNDYTELGTVFNSFSLLLADAPIIRTGKSKEQEQEESKLNIILDKMGQVFDRSYITINSLIGDLETRFSEPLGEEVQYSNSLNFVQKFQNRKLKQFKLLEHELADKKVTLGELIKAEEESNNIEGVINRDQAAKNTNYQLDNSPNGTNGSYSSRFKFSNITSIKKITQYVTDIMDQNPQQTRKQRVSDLKIKINTLEKCRSIMMADISYIADELEKNLQSFHKKQLKVIYDILMCYNGFLVNWAKKNLEIWEEIREEIVKL